MSLTPRIELIGLPDLPLIEPGDDLAAMIAAALDRNGLAPAGDDVLVIAHKIVSKAEGRLVDLGSVKPSERAQKLAAQTAKDPRLVEVILSESTRIVRSRPGLLIAEHRLGYVMANAGVDQSNVAADRRVLLLPLDPDASAEGLRQRLCARFGCALAVIINDSFGRAWRHGTVGIALGVAGLPALRDLRGEPDLFGRKLQVTVVGFADEIAAAASLIMGQAAEKLPVVLVRGLTWKEAPSPARSLIRPAAEDLFR
jgi:coenzyme F420-0:L-glutamate ligase / coenzyme F420-1:gamma-L-glutamate ligase